MKSSKLLSALCLGVCIVWQSGARPANAVSDGIVVSQVYGGGGNSGATYKNDFIELFNRGVVPVDVSGWSLQYASSAGSTWQVTRISGIIPPGRYLLVQEAAGAGGTVDLPPPDATGSIAMSATAGKVALVASTVALTGTGCPAPGAPANVVDFVGYGGANCYEGSATPALSNTNAAIRKNGGAQDTDVNSADFTVAPPVPHTSGNPKITAAAAAPPEVFAGNTTALTAVVIPGTDPASTGLTVTGDLSSIGGAASQAFYDDGTHGDAAPNDNTFTFEATVAVATPLGPKSIGLMVSDAQGRTSSKSVTVTITSPTLTAIHDIQGSGSASPMAGQFVITTGIVTARKSNGFFLQARDADVDGDPGTSEGVFVFTSSPPPASIAVGSFVRVAGTVAEFVPPSDPGSPPMTEIGSPAVTVLGTGEPLPAASPVLLSDFINPAVPGEPLERLEGMRVTAETLVAIAPTGGSINETIATSTSNGTFYGVLPGIARPFREPGIEAGDPAPAEAVSPSTLPRFDGNAERIRVETATLGGAPVNVTTGATITGVVGVADFRFRSTAILTAPAQPPTVDGNLSAVPVSVPDGGHFTVASFNMQRFFDTTNDPAIDEPVLTPAAFANRLNKASLAIRQVLHAPDIIGVEEVENLETLQAIAAKVNADAAAASELPLPSYAAYLAEGNDVGGIDVGLLVNNQRVSVVEVAQFGKMDTYFNTTTQKDEPLNDRPPLVLRATVQAPKHPLTAVTVIVNHLRSLSSIDDPVDGPRVRTKRRLQAEYLANLIQARQVANPAERIVSVGDYNAFQFNDGFVDVIGTVKGTPADADHVAQASADLVDPDLIDLVDTAPAGQRYSYVFDGNAQELDHILINQNVAGFVEYARNDADFPEVYRNDAARPERISDHDMVVGFLELAPDVTPPTIVSVVPSQAVLWPPTGAMIPVTIAISATDDVSASCEVTGVTGDDGAASTDAVVTGADSVEVRAARRGGGNGRTYTVAVRCADPAGNTSTATATIVVPHDQRR